MARIELKTEHTGFLSGKQNGPILVNREIRKLGDLQTVHVDGKDFPVQQSGAIWTTTAPALKWYVATMDYMHEEVDSKKDAIATCVAAAMDFRKRPPITEISSGFYEYLAPDSEGAGRRAMFFIGTRDTLLEHGFEYQLQEWEREDEEE